MRNQDSHKLKFKAPFMDAEASGWGIVALVVIVMIVCIAPYILGSEI